MRNYIKALLIGLLISACTDPMDHIEPAPNTIIVVDEPEPIKGPEPVVDNSQSIMDDDKETVEVTTVTPTTEIESSSNDGFTVNVLGQGTVVALSLIHI